MISMYSTMLSNAYRRTKKWAWHLGVALDDSANVRKSSGSAPAREDTSIFSNYRTTTLPKFDTVHMYIPDPIPGIHHQCKKPGIGFLQTKFVGGDVCCRFTVKSWYLLVFRAVLLDRFVSKPTVRSRIYKQFLLKVRRRSGRKLSPIITDGLIKPGRSAHNAVSLIPCNDDAINLRTESCHHVYRPSSR